MNSIERIDWILRKFESDDLYCGHIRVHNIDPQTLFEYLSRYIPLSEDWIIVHLDKYNVTPMSGLVRIPSSDKYGSIYISSLTEVQVREYLRRKLDKHLILIQRILTKLDITSIKSTNIFRDGLIIKSHYSPESIQRLLNDMPISSVKSVSPLKVRVKLSVH